MPNWVDNTLIVTGEEEDLDKFQKEVSGTGWNPENKEINLLDFNTIIPMPEHIVEDDYSPVGYNWECENWGVKWGASRAESIRTATDSLKYVFETPWSPALEMYKAIIEKYPKLHFEFNYAEWGMMFGGMFRGALGIVVVDESWDLTEADVHDGGFHDGFPEDYPSCVSCQEILGVSEEMLIRKEIEESYNG